MFGQNLRTHTNPEHQGSNPHLVLREDSHAVQCQQWRRILRPEVLRRLNLSSAELPGWAAGVDLVSHQRSLRDLLVSLWASTLGGEEGWACELSGRDCKVKRESNRGEGVKGKWEKGKWEKRKWWGMGSAGRLNRRDWPIYRYESHKKVEKFEWWETKWSVPNRWV